MRIMSKVTFEDGAFNVDAELLGREFGIAPAMVQAHMRDGRITSRCERGIDEDAGRWRLTFFHDKHRLRLVVDKTGTILERSLESPLPARALHRGRQARR